MTCAPHRDSHWRLVSLVASANLRPEETVASASLEVGGGEQFSEFYVPEDRRPIHRA